MMNRIAKLSPVNIGSAIWFDTSDTAAALQLEHDELLELLREEYVTAAPYQPETYLVSEAGLYALAALRDEGLRHALDHWVFSCMLPYLRMSVAALMNGETLPTPAASEPPPALSALLATLAAPRTGGPIH